MLLHGDSLDASLTVTDLDRSASWYTSILGFTIDRRHERGGKLIALSLMAGAVRLLLSQDDGTRSLDRARGEALSLRITTRQDIDALAAAIKAQGVTLDTEPMTAHGYTIFRLHDPDGFRFTVSSPHVA